MRTALLTLLLLFSSFAPGDGEKEGRRGNALYEQERYDAAVAAFLSGLSGDGVPPEVQYGLTNNLGAAQLRAGDAEASLAAFTRASGAARTNADYVRSTYNAGNAAVAAEDLEGALAHYRRALLADPANEAAKFNYEFVKRQLEQQQQQQEQQQDGDRDEQGEQQEDPQQGQQDQDQQQDQEGQPQQEPQGEQQQQDPQQGQPQQEPQQGEQQPQPQQNPNELSQAQAERMLQALQNEEEQLLRQVQRPPSRGRRVDKDW